MRTIVAMAITAFFLIFAASPVPAAELSERYPEGTAKHIFDNLNALRGTPNIETNSDSSICSCPYWSFINSCGKGASWRQGILYFVFGMTITGTYRLLGPSGLEYRDGSCGTPFRVDLEIKNGFAAGLVGESNALAISKIFTFGRIPAAESEGGRSVAE